MCIRDSTHSSSSAVSEMTGLGYNPVAWHVIFRVLVSSSTSFSKLNESAGTVKSEFSNPNYKTSKYGTIPGGKYNILPVSSLVYTNDAHEKNYHLRGQ